jgi:hypothetical protein
LRSANGRAALLYAVDHGLLARKKVPHRGGVFTVVARFFLDQDPELVSKRARLKRGPPSEHYPQALDALNPLLDKFNPIQPQSSDCDLTARGPVDNHRALEAEML